MAIAGGHGQIALRLAALLSKRGEEVSSLIRDPAQAEDVRGTGAEPVVCDLESASAGELAEAIRGSDAVVFAAGAGPGSSPEHKETVDYGGAVKLIEAARNAGIDRYLMISAIRADPDHPGDETFDVYLRAKGRADAKLEASGLDYTIVRPGLLTDQPGTGRVELGPEVERGSISRDDVGAVLAATLGDRRTVGRSFDLVGGARPIDEALEALDEGPP